jgi:excisionase family DNA binding protein
VTETPWLTAEEAKSYLAFPSVKALYEAVRRGTIPVHKIGRRLRFDRRELEKLLSR